MTSELIVKLTAFFLLSAYVNSSPETLQRLYGTPHLGDHDHPTNDHHEHEGDHAHPELSTLPRSESISEFNADAPVSIPTKFEISKEDLKEHILDKIGTDLARDPSTSTAVVIDGFTRVVPTLFTQGPTVINLDSPNSFGADNLNGISSNKFRSNLSGRGSSNTGRGKSVQEIIKDAQAFRNLNEDRTHDFVFSSQSGQVALDGSLKDGNVPTLELARGLNQPNYEDLTITVEHTRDVYTTFTNTIYNSIPVTLTQFVKSTTVVPTVLVEGTPVDDKVLVSTVPVVRTGTIYYTDEKTAYQYATEVSTDIYTITHRAYDIQQQVVSSTLVQTKVIRPTVVSTVILTEVETSTAYQTVTNTVIIEPRAPQPGNAATLLPFSNFDLRVNDHFVAPLVANNVLENNQEILSKRQHDLIDLVVSRDPENPMVALLRGELDALRRSSGFGEKNREIFQVNLAQRQEHLSQQLRNSNSVGGPSGSLQGSLYSPPE